MPVSNLSGAIWYFFKHFPLLNPDFSLEKPGLKKHTFESYASTPYVVAANKQDAEDAWEPDDLRIILRLKPEVKVLPCVSLDKESVKNVLLELLYSVLERIDENSGND